MSRDEGNEVSGESSISGEYNNHAMGLRSSVSGGYGSKALGNLLSVLGGKFNGAKGKESVVL